MSDEPQATYQPGAEAGQPSQPPVGGEPKYVTEDALLQMEDRLTRRLQSLTDKQESRVTKMLDKWQTALEAQGIPATSEMLNRKRLELATAEADRALLDDNQPAQAVAPQAGDPHFEEVKARVNARMAQLETEHGVKLESTDREYKRLNWINPDPDDFLEAYEEALKNKKGRNGGQQLPPNPARVPGPGGAPGGNRLEELTRRYNEIQATDPFSQNRKLTEERKTIRLEMDRLENIPHK